MTLLLHKKKFVSCAYQLCVSHSKTENRACYGEEWSQTGIGSNLSFTASFLLRDKPQQYCEKDIDAALGRITGELDHKFLNHDISFFSTNQPTLENLGQYLFNRFKTTEGLAVNPVQITVDDGYHSRAWVGRDTHVLWSRRCKISCLHVHRNPQWSDERNKNVYGKCSNLHGHEYQLEFIFKNTIDPHTGLSVRRGPIDSHIQEQIIGRHDKSTINEFVPNASGEMIGSYFFGLSKDYLDEFGFYALRLQETKKNSFLFYS